jgi:hypothetical protein
MQHVYAAIEAREVKVAVVESPTGTVGFDCVFIISSVFIIASSFRYSFRPSSLPKSLIDFFAEP